MRRSLKRSTKKGRKGVRKSMKGGNSVWCCNTKGCTPKTSNLCGFNDKKYVCNTDEPVDSNDVLNKCGQSLDSVGVRSVTAPARVVQGTAHGIGKVGAPVVNGMGSAVASMFTGGRGKRKTNKRRR